jgi:hypothetical protein
MIDSRIPPFRESPLASPLLILALSGTEGYHYWLAPILLNFDPIAFSLGLSLCRLTEREFNEPWF